MTLLLLALGLLAVPMPSRVASASPTLAAAGDWASEATASSSASPHATCRTLASATPPQASTAAKPTHAVAFW